MKALKILGATTFAAMMAGCASTGNVPSVGKMLGEATGQNGRACVRLSDIRSYGVLKGDIISINGTGNDYYLATVLPGCNDLHTSIGVIFSGGFGEICGQSMNKVATTGDHCVINKIYEFESQDEAFALYNEVLEKREELKSGDPAG